MVKEIWDAIAHSYSNRGDCAQIYELKNRIYDTKQQEALVTLYYKLWSSCQELDHY